MEILTASTILVMFLFLTFLCLMEGVYWFFMDSERRGQRQLKKRMDHLRNMDISSSGKGSLLKIKDPSSIPLLDRLLEQLRGLKPLQTLMNQADVHWRLEIFLLLEFLAGMLGAALGAVKFGLGGGLVGGVLGLVLPIRILVFKKKRRLKQFEKQLPEALELMARGLKAGHAFATGLQLVADELPDPLGGEFFKTFKEHNHGLDLNNALLNLCNRIDLRDLRFFTTAVMIQRETGGNLADILDKIATLIRERFKLRNQIKALTSEGRLSGLVLVLLPPATGLAMFFMNPDYILLLVQTSLGQIMTGGALLLQGLGMFCIRSIVNIKV